MADVLDLTEGQVLTREDLNMVRQFILATREEGWREGIEKAARFFDRRAEAFRDLVRRHEKSGRHKHADRDRDHAIREQTLAKSLRALAQEGREG